MSLRLTPQDQAEYERRCAINQTWKEYCTAAGDLVNVKKARQANTALYKEFEGRQLPEEVPEPAEPLAYAFEPEDVAKLRAVSARLNSPRALSFDNRRDLANLIDLLCSRAIEINLNS